MNTSDITPLTTGVEDSPSKLANESAVRLGFLEGMRGLAAFYVVLAHCQQQVRGILPNTLLDYTRWMQYGHWAVDVFIILSGYCLMLPVVRSGDGQLRGGVVNYFIRRAKRIIPPYYAAIILSLLILTAMHSITKSGLNAGDYKNNFSVPVLLSHIFLVHNFSLRWIYAINPAMWSVATEWQIYFVFPAILLPVWRRLGSIAAVVTGFALGLILHFILPTISNFDWAYPWYIGLFALGIAGANIGFSTVPLEIKMRRGPWGSVGIMLIILIGLLIATHSRILDNAYITDALIGLLTVSGIVHAARYLTDTQNGPRPWLLRVCDTKGVLLLGSFSYSLYLIHVPIIEAIFALLLLSHANMILIFGLLLGVGIPTSLAAAYLFSLAFEKPFLASQRVRGIIQEKAVVL